MELDQLLGVVDALNNKHRLRVIAALHGRREYVSELARQLGLSRPLLYMHLGKLEDAGLVESEMEISEDGKAMKYYSLCGFELSLDAASITRAVEAARDEDEGGDA